MRVSSWDVHGFSSPSCLMQRLLCCLGTGWALLWQSFVQSHGKHPRWIRVMTDQPCHRYIHQAISGLYVLLCQLGTHGLTILMGSMHGPHTSLIVWHNRAPLCSLVDPYSWTPHHRSHSNHSHGWCFSSISPLAHWYTWAPCSSPRATSIYCPPLVPWEVTDILMLFWVFLLLWFLGVGFVLLPGMTLCCPTALGHRAVFHLPSWPPWPSPYPLP